MAPSCRGVPSPLQGDTFAEIYSKARAIELHEIASQAQLPENQVGLLLLLMYQYNRFFSSAGSRSQGYYGYETISFDTDSYKRTMAFENMSDVIMNTFKQKSVNDLEEESLSNDNKQATIATRVLAIHYLLYHCGVNSVDNPTSVAKFIQFLTGQELSAKRIQDTNIYKKVTKPFRLNDKLLIKELQAIRPFFIELGFNDIVTKIDKEISQSQMSIDDGKLSRDKKSG